MYRQKFILVCMVPLLDIIVVIIIASIVYCTRLGTPGQLAKYHRVLFVLYVAIRSTSI